MFCIGTKFYNMEMSLCKYLNRLDGADIRVRQWAGFLRLQVVLNGKVRVRGNLHRHASILMEPNVVP